MKKKSKKKWIKPEKIIFSLGISAISNSTDCSGGGFVASGCLHGGPWVSVCENGAGDPNDCSNGELPFPCTTGH